MNEGPKIKGPIPKENFVNTYYKIRSRWTLSPVNLGLFKAACIMVLAMLFGSSCRKKEEISGSEFSLSFPSNFPAPRYNGGTKNPITREGILLGRMLFYDPMLSADSTISCSSCHQQFAAFSHLDHNTSHGIDGLFGTRNSPAVQNMAWNPEFMWDGGINHLEVMPVAPITNPVEMDETMVNVVKKLNRNAGYRLRFREVFGNDSIDDQQVLLAFAQFMTSMISANSKYDHSVRNENKVKLSVDELQGRSIFKQKCSECHATDLFTDFSYRNNGITNNDVGRELITGNSSDRNKFKVPSLRNAALTRPYMHDGSKETLRDVLDHYDTGISASSTLDPAFTRNGYTGIELSEEEKDKLLIFLNTLTDEDFIRNKNFSDPF